MLKQSHAIVFLGYPFLLRISSLFLFLFVYELYGSFMPIFNLIL